MAGRTKRSAKDLDVIDFKLWLMERGAEFFDPTNAYEVLRFNTPTGMGLVYRSERLAVSAMNPAAKIAFEQYVKNGAWRAVDATIRIYMSPKRKALMARDGNRCVYCNHEFGDDEVAIIEHVVPVTAGGPNHMSNLALACSDCDKAVGVKSAAEKIRFALQKQPVGTT